MARTRCVRRSATLYYKKTKDVATLMEIFGHSSEKITKRYIGINEDEISETLLNFRLGFSHENK
ncbi:hypothetical protein B795N_21020 [Marinilactibacillus psychrotolerans]|nr:hypothetical protein B795N_21020 [Marinilactibacillus psychrotolerans]